MGLWQGFVNSILDSMSYFVSVFGNVGLIILVMSLVVRFALLPLSVKIARRTRERMDMMNLLKPELEKIKTDHKNNPEVITRKTMELYKKNGIKIVDTLSVIGFLIQIPIFIGMFTAVSKIIAPSQYFLWIANLARPDFLLTIIAAVLTWVSGLLAPKSSAQQGSLMTWMPVILTLVFLWKLSAGIGLYWVASSVVSVFQSMILRYTSKENRSYVVVSS